MPALTMSRGVTRQSSWAYIAKLSAVNFESGWPESSVAPEGVPAKKSSRDVEQERFWFGEAHGKSAAGSCDPKKLNRPRPLLKTSASASKCVNSPPILREWLPF